jgi:hypothetical protein
MLGYSVLALIFDATVVIGLCSCSDYHRSESHHHHSDCCRFMYISLGLLFTKIQASIVSVERRVLPVASLTRSPQARAISGG